MTWRAYVPLGAEDETKLYLPRYGGLLWGLSWPDNRYDYATQGEREAVSRVVLEQVAKKDLPVMEEGNSSFAFKSGSTDITPDIESVLDLMSQGHCRPAISFNAMHLPYQGESATSPFKYEWQNAANENDWWVKLADGTYPSATANYRFIDFSHPTARNAYVEMVIRHQRTYQGMRAQFFDELHNYCFPNTFYNVMLYQDGDTRSAVSDTIIRPGGYWQDVMGEVLNLYYAKGGLPAIGNGEQPWTDRGRLHGRMWQRWSLTNTISSLVEDATPFFNIDPRERLLLVSQPWVDSAAHPDHAPPQWVNAGMLSETDLSYGDRQDTSNLYRNRNTKFNSSRSWTNSGGAGTWSGSTITWSTGTALYQRLCRFNVGVSALIDGISNVDGETPFRWPWQYTPYTRRSFGIPIEYTDNYLQDEPHLVQIACGDRYVWVRYFTSGILVVNEGNASFTDDGTLIAGERITASFTLQARSAQLSGLGDATFIPVPQYRLPL